MKRALVCLLSCTLVSMTITTPAQARRIKVLHVSEVMQSEVQAILDHTGTGSLFDVTEMSYWDEYHPGPPENLEEYDVIVFGLSDCLDVVRDLDELYSFVAGGGGVIFTHDSAANIYPLSVRDMVGVGAPLDPDSADAGWVWGNWAQILQDHAVLHCPFEIGDVGDSLEIQRTHTVVALESAHKILKLPGTDAANNWYLAVKEFGAGRVVASQIGHSVYQCYVDPTQIPEPGEPPVLREEQLFINCLFWAGTNTPTELCYLIRLVRQLGLPTGIETSLLATLEATARALENHNAPAATGSLGAFIGQVESQRGKAIPPGDAEVLIAAAQEIIHVVNHM